MYIDLNVPVPVVQTQAIKKDKGKGKQLRQQSQSSPGVTFTPAQISAIESRIDLLIHLGYTVIAFNQTVHKKIDPKTHVNALDALFAQLRRRNGVALLKRLTIVLDEDSEKGFGLTTGNASIVAPYDLLALTPTTAASFSLACLTHTQPSPLTAHIISLPLTLPRLPFNLKHTLVRSALKNGAVFEITYSGALGAESDPGLGLAGATEGGSGPKRNWWAAAREVVRVTKGRGVIVSGGCPNVGDLRAPRDVGNLLTFLGLPQNLAHDASTKTPHTLLLRAQTRKTYRAILSEPKLVIPDNVKQTGSALGDTSQEPQHGLPTQVAGFTAQESVSMQPKQADVTDSSSTTPSGHAPTEMSSLSNSRKRSRDEASSNNEVTNAPADIDTDQSSSRKKKRKGKTAGNI
ncbi:PHP domain-like protein [Panus rudis PR-1116 ss-1]|nr:PHP domain-like protein [Panus rudis PR-1116 ss-1]